MSDTETDPPSGTAQQTPLVMASSSVSTNVMAMTPGILPPGKLNMAENWKVWKQLMSNCVIIAKLGTQPPEYKVALFLHCIGIDMLKIFNGFQFDSPDDRNNLSKIIEKFDQYTIGELNETFERYNFNSRNQEENESIDAYVTALRTLAKTCNFCDCMRASILRDRIVLGVRDKHTQKQLLQERNLDLKKCIDICRSTEASNSQLRQISAAQSEDVHGMTNNSFRRDVLTSQRRTGNQKKSLAKHANFVVKFMFTKKASVPRGEPHVLNVKEEIISPPNATARSTV